LDQPEQRRACRHSDGGNGDIARRTIGVASALQSAVIGPRDDPHDSTTILIPPRPCWSPCVRPVQLQQPVSALDVALAGCALANLTGGAVTKTRSLMRVRTVGSTKAVKMSLMDGQTAKQIVADMRLVRGAETTWEDPMHIATTTFRGNAGAKLSRDPQLAEGWAISLVEIHLTEALPDIDKFEGVLEVDDVGIWYYDGDGSIDDPVWRQRVIPWQFVKGLTLHQAS
jgi:hypothetical protein